MNARTLRASVLAGVVMVVLGACAPQVPTTPSGPRTVTPLAACPQDGGPAVPPRSVTFQGRSSALFAPIGYQPGVSYPLLVSLHPFILAPDPWEAYSGLVAAARQRGYFVLLPQGSEPGPRWAVPGGLDTGIDDIGWVDGLIQQTASQVCIDGDRVFAAGYSAGAAMSVGLSCELAGRFRAIAGSGGTNLTSLCPNSGPVSALILHGTADPIAPITGNTIEFTPPVNLSVDSVVQSFVTRDGCLSVPTKIDLSATVVVDRYSCPDKRLEYFRMNGAGHTWAGSPISLDIVTGPTDQSFSATNAVLDFFGVA